MKTIAIDIKNLALYESGITGFIKPLLKAWMKSAPENRFLLIGPKFNAVFLQELENYKKVEISILEGLPSSAQAVIYDYWSLPRVLSGLQYDVFYSPYYDFYLPNCVRSRSIVTIHDLCYLKLPNQYKAKTRWYFEEHLKRNAREAQRVITVSEASKADIVNTLQISPEKIWVVYNSIDPEFQLIQPDLRLQNDIRKRLGLGEEKICLYTGGIENRKNVNRLLQAIRKIKQDYGIDLRLIITGPAHLAEFLRPLICDLGIEDNVVFSGMLLLHELKQVYYIADVIAYPSLLEGFGRSIIEAMCVGKPIVCSDIPVMHEVGRDYPLFCDPFDVASIAEKIVQGIRVVCTSVVPEEFCLDNNVKRFLNAVNI